jgi:hypothetical protein
MGPEKARINPKCVRKKNTFILKLSSREQIVFNKKKTPVIWGYFMGVEIHFRNNG